MNSLCSALPSIFVLSKLELCLYVWYPQEWHSQLFSATSSCVKGLKTTVFILYDKVQIYCVGSPVESICSLFLCSALGGAELSVLLWGDRKHRSAPPGLQSWGYAQGSNMCSLPDLHWCSFTFCRWGEFKILSVHEGCYICYDLC